MKKSRQYILLTWGLSWTAVGIAYALGLRLTDLGAYTAFAAAYMMLPGFVVLILQKIHQEELFKQVAMSLSFNRWFLLAILFPVLLTFAALGINLQFPFVQYSSHQENILAMLTEEQAAQAQEGLSSMPGSLFLLITLSQAILAGCTINAFFALGEELGWRGYLMRELSNMPVIYSAIFTGAVWGLWHFPLILMGHNYPQHPLLGVPMMIIWCILLSPVMSYLRVKSKSVISAALFHGTLNAVAGMALLYISGGNDLTNGLTGLAGFIALAILNGLLFLYDRYITKERIFTSCLSELERS
ncbi:MAG: CPBP family intramembrane metalloprotease [Treponema sp.]|nr:CPBP family intramembrane metalloprotease [Treponema sp.]